MRQAESWAKSECKQISHVPLDCCYPSFTSASRHFARDIQHVNSQRTPQDFSALHLDLNTTPTVSIAVSFGTRDALLTKLTMPKVKQSTLAGLIDSDSDDGFAMPTPDSAAENKAPGKKARGRPKTAPLKPAPSKVTKTKAKGPARRTSGRLVAKAIAVDSAPAKTKRPALKDKTNQVYDEEVDDFDQDLVMEGTLEESIVTVKKTKPKVTKKTATTKGKATKDVWHTSTINESTAEVLKPEAHATKKRGPAKKQKAVEPSPEKVVQETQYEDMDVDTDVDEILEEPEPEPISKPTHTISRTQSHSRRRQPSVQRRRARSASDTERSDPALRRKLGELTKKYETLNLKYQDLREIGLKEAERNFERLRKETESKTKSKSHCPTDCNIVNPN